MCRLQETVRKNISGIRDAEMRAIIGCRGIFCMNYGEKHNVADITEFSHTLSRFLVRK